MLFISIRLVCFRKILRLMADRFIVFCFSFGTLTKIVLRLRLVDELVFLDQIHLRLILLFFAEFVQINTDAIL